MSEAILARYRQASQLVAIKVDEFDFARAALRKAEAEREDRRRELIETCRGQGDAAAESLPWRYLAHYADSGRWEALAGVMIYRVFYELPLLVSVLGKPVTLEFNGLTVHCGLESTEASLGATCAADRASWSR